MKNSKSAIAEVKDGTAFITRHTYSFALDTPSTVIAYLHTAGYLYVGDEGIDITSTSPIPAMLRALSPYTYRYYTRQGYIDHNGITEIGRERIADLALAASLERTQYHIGNMKNGTYSDMTEIIIKV